MAVADIGAYHASLRVFNQLHVMELKPAFVEAATGHEDEIFTIAKGMLATPDTAPALDDFVLAEQAAERLRDGFAEYFRRFDAQLCPGAACSRTCAWPSGFVINGQTVSADHIPSATVPFNVTCLPALSIRFGTSRDGLPIGVQLVFNWFAESTILHLASLLETVSPVRDLHPNI